MKFTMSNNVVLLLLHLFCSTLGAQEITMLRHNIQKYEQLDGYLDAYTIVRVEDFPTEDVEKLRVFLDGNPIWDLNLKRTALLSDHYQSNNPSTTLRVRPYHGSLSGNPNSGVSLTIGSEFLYGYVDDGVSRMLVEPLRYHVSNAARNLFLLYKREDIIPTTDRSCGTDTRLQKHRRIIGQMQRQAQSSAAGDCWVIELAIASDYQMYTKYNSSITEVEDHNIAVMNDVATDYKGPFEDTITFKIVEQYVVNCSGCDPWTSSTDAGTLLDDFVDWGEAGGFNCSYDLGQLWTARNFNGGVIGIAYLGAVCSSVKYHALQDINGAEDKRVLTSHEIGHNFDASHAPTSGFIMSPFLNITTNWHQSSKNSINSFVNFLEGQGCMDPCLYDPPSVSFSASHSTVCVGGQVYFDDQSSGNPTEWQWSFPGGSPSSSFEENPVVSYGSVGTYDVSLTATNEHGSTTESFFGSITVVDGGTGEFVLFNDDFEFGLDSWTVDNPDNSFTWEQVPSHSSKRGSMSARVNFFDYGGSGQKDALISNTFDLTNQVGVKCTFEYAYARESFSSNDELNVYVSTDGGNSFPNLVYSDDGSNLSFRTSADKDVGLFNPCSEDDWCGTNCIDIDLSAYDGEANFALKIEAVNRGGNALYIDNFYLVSACEPLEPPVALFSSNLSEGCISFDVQYFDDSEGTVADRLWTFEGGTPATSTAQNPIVTYHTPGYWDVTLEVSNSAGSSTSFQDNWIWARDVPESNFSYQVSGLTVFFTNQSFDANSYFWDFGDGGTSTEENPTHTYASGGQYIVSLQAINECGSSFHTEEIELLSSPVASFTASPTSGCPVLEVQYFDDSEGEVDSRLWSFPGGVPESSTEQNPVVSYESGGSYSSTLVVTNAAGSDTLTKENYISVDPLTISSFDYSQQFATVHFMNRSTDWTSLEWDFGDGNTSVEENPSHSYTADATYRVRLVSSNACGSDTSYQDVTVSTSNMLAFEADTTKSCVEFVVQFQNNSSAQYTSYSWTFEGGMPATSTESNPTVRYTSRGVYDVMLIGTATTRVDTLVKTDYIVADDVPIADFAFDQDQLTFSFHNLSQYATSYLWDFGDGNTSTEENPTHTYLHEGEYHVLLTAYNACGEDAKEIDMHVELTPLVVRISPGPTTICKDSTIQFRDISSGPPESRLWTFEGGTPASSTEAVVDVTYSESGIYSVILEISRAGETVRDTLQNAVTVLDPPRSNFSFSYQTDNKVKFTNLSTDATSYLWDFGDGNTSTEFSPVHEYAVGGNYDVVLHAVGICGTDSNSLKVDIISSTTEVQTLKHIDVFPNPTSDQLHIRWGNPEPGRLSIVVYNLLGRELVRLDERVHTSELYEKSIDLSTWPAGSYFLKIRQGEKQHIEPIVLIR